MSGRIVPGANGRWISYDYAVLRVVPHVYLGTFVPVGVMVHARTADFLGMRVIADEAQLRTRVPGVDLDLLVRYLRACRLVCEGDATAGPVALAPPSERFHWLTAPRSDVIQSSPVHSGMTEDPKAALDELYARFIEPAA
ncbi:MAG TPA: DUF3037 domain-containing protein [Gemmatimonadaceae bacterium]|nr:DUF3037 domain-containing protein [Gemmatimonadaceae bacterium]